MSRRGIAGLRDGQVKNDLSGTILSVPSDKVLTSGAYPGPTDALIPADYVNGSGFRVSITPYGSMGITEITCTLWRPGTGDIEEWVEPDVEGGTEYTHDFEANCNPGDFFLFDSDGPAMVMKIMGSQLLIYDMDGPEWSE